MPSVVCVGFFSASVHVTEDTRSSMQEAFIEEKLSSTEILRSPEEFRHWLTIYMQLIVKNGNLVLFAWFRTLHTVCFQRVFTLNVLSLKKQ